MMVDWEITATTILCEAVGDEVTLIVSRDGTIKCSGQQKYTKDNKEAAKILKKKSRKLGRKLGCEGTGCASATGYRDGLLGKK
ncbi:MAG: hypothetical protein WC370_09840 [Dehalococcoidales bacterium]|jgi:hypothetical protein